MSLTYGSLFSGVGGLDRGVELAGFRTSWMCEIDPWRREVLHAHWPDAVIHDDVTTFDTGAVQPVDLLIGGFPCQDVSKAGKRAGLEGSRSGLFWEAMRVAEDLTPRAILLENVPGLLTSNDRADFAVVLDALVDRGYGVAWRVLDACHFGVPQRRRRLWLCAVAGSDTRAAAECAGEVLGLPEGRPRRTRPGIAPWALVASRVGGRSSVNGGEGGYVVFRKGRRAQSVDDPETWVADGTANCINRFDQGESRSTHLVIGFPEVAGTLTKRYFKGINTTMDDGAIVVERPIAFDSLQTPVSSEDLSHTLTTNGNMAIAHETTVRRLTPVETERLMCWPDEWTAPPGVKASLSRRYAACGDGVVSVVPFWIALGLKALWAT